jgi:glycosyltransferase involved in cell wall biosynthesis
VKLIIQIPCLNEESALPVTLSELPREVDGFDEVEWLIIDDGSTDRTVEIAREHGVDHVVRFTQNKGLAVAFQAGMDAALKLGADVIVNTDADNQYNAADIPLLVQPILENRADMVIGDRQVADHPEFSSTKKLLQRWGSWVVRQASETDIPDTTSGFRAYSREAALRLNVVSRFTYTLETIIQAGKSDIAVASVPIRVNGKLRPSRLFKSIPDYIKRSVGTIFRIYAMYEPLRIFATLAAMIGLVGVALFARFSWFYATEEGPTGHIQSLVVGGVLILVAVQLFLLGIIGDLLRANRVIGERTLQRVRHLELALGVRPDSLASNPPEQREGVARE